MVSYNITREVERLLETYKSSPPSFIVKLERQHWYVNENKFTYNHQLAPLLDDIRAQRIPVDFLELFDSVGLPFYDGCMIVELHDFRSPTRASDKDIKEPVKTRVVLSPNGETLWADICLLNQKTGNTWTGYDALEVEARLLLATSPPLCLDPDPHLARVANNILRTSIPTPPLSLKRKAGAAELEEDPSGKARREKLMQYMNPRTGNGVPNYGILDAIRRTNMARQIPAAAPPHPATIPTMPVQVPGAPVQVQGVPVQAPGVPVQMAVAPSQVPTAVPTPAPAPMPTPTPTPAPSLAPGSAAFSHTTPVSASTPAPTVTTPPVNVEAKKKAKKTEAAPSPRVTRTSATPGTTSVPLPIPPHLQTYPAHFQAHIRTPPPPSQSPHPATPSTPGRSSTGVETRPPSRLQQLPTQTNQHIQPVQPQQHAAPTQPQQAIAAYQPHTPAANYIAQAPYGKKKAAQAAQPGTVPSQPQAIPYAQIMYHYSTYQHQQQQVAAAQQRLQSATPVARSPMAASQQGTPQRSSPLVTNQPPVARSPMPTAAQQSAQATHAQQQHMYNYALQGQYGPAAHMRPMAHPQMQHHIAGGGVQAGGATALQQGAQMTIQEQTQAAQAQMLAQYPQLYANYPHMQGRVPYWPMGVASGRGAPVPNQAAQMAHVQQMQLAGNKAAQGGIQGS
ncbi:predicted protein [Sparassis crispa]|uniref:Spt20-like SEP domain-containing protein n=1 Tax=Sparassis crispa TaxID=139825 RepID=A0A401GWS1_9APHY|nr:predicted protein [Sparassis crispa]GBE86619.1 predicted protein [Sparassis crispa]